MFFIFEKHATVKRGEYQYSTRLQLTLMNGVANLNNGTIVIQILPVIINLRDFFIDLL